MNHTVHMPRYYHTPTLSGQAMCVAGYAGMQCCRGRQLVGKEDIKVWSKYLLILNTKTYESNGAHAMVLPHTYT